jgi:hypothetical protein
MFFTAALPSPRQVCNCSDGSTSAGCGTGDTNEGGTYLSWASSPAGPWSAPVLLYIDPVRAGDTNLSPVIRSDGSLIGIWRKCCHAVPEATGSWPLLAKASHWADKESYSFGSRWILPELGPLQPSAEYTPSLGTEDPHLYIDSNNRLHAMFHNMAPCVVSATVLLLLIATTSYYYY